MPTVPARDVAPSGAVVESGGKRRSRRGRSLVPGGAMFVPLVSPARDFRSAAGWCGPGVQPGAGPEMI